MPNAVDPARSLGSHIVYWAYVPSCPRNGPPGSVGEQLCPGALFACGGNAVLFREFNGPSRGGPWAFVRAVCLTAADFSAAGAPPPGVVALELWKRMRFSAPALRVKPGVRGLVNLPSYFWVGGPFVQTGTAGAPLPFTVSVEARVRTFDWSFGDGSPALSTSDPGQPWPAKSDVAHVFQRRGRFAVTVTEAWHGTFRVDGGPPQDVPGPDITVASTVPYPVQDLVVTLTQ
jgi:PKD domain